MHSRRTRLWAQLSVFAGSFELEAAEDICGDDLAPGELLDLLSSLVDKSILSRTESNGVIRFRLLETLRDYGREQIRQTDEYAELRRRPGDWYRRLALAAAAGWFSPRQVEWIERLEREMPNVREALEFVLSDSGENALAIAAVCIRFGWPAACSEGRRWLDRALAQTPSEPTAERVRAIYGAAVLAELQGDLPTGSARVAEARALVEHMADPLVHGLVGIAEGLAALMAGDSQRASACLEDAFGKTDDPTLQAAAMLLLGWGLEFRGETTRALIWQEKALALSESHGESVYRGYALWSIGVGWWRHGDRDRAEQLLKECLRATHRVNDPRQSAASLEALAWIGGETRDPWRAVVLMAAAEALGRSVGSTAVVLPHLQVFHDECQRRAREALDAEEFEAAHLEGYSLSFDEAVAYALQETA